MPTPGEVTVRVVPVIDWEAAGDAPVRRQPAAIDAPMDRISLAVLRHIGIDTDENRVISVGYYHRAGDVANITVVMDAVDLDGNFVIEDGEQVREVVHYEWRRSDEEGE